MTARLAVVLFLVVLAGGTAAWFLTRDRSRAPEAAVPAAAALAREPARTALLADDGERGAVAPEPAIAPAPTASDIAVPEFELTLQEVVALQTPVPPGSLEVVVLRGHEPVAGAAILLLDGSADRTLFEPPDGPIARSRSGLDGTCAFHGLDAGRYRVRVELGQTARREVEVVLRAQGASRRVVVALGLGSIRGRVWDELGLPASDRIVEVACFTPLPGRHQFEAATRTAPDGAYAVDELVPGRYWVTEIPRGRRGDEANRSVQVELRSGATAVVDFGSPERRGTWSGRVLTRAGTPAPGPGWLRLERLDGDGTGVIEDQSYDEQGRFSVPLAPGRYAVRTWALLGQHPLGEIAMEAHDLTQDLVLPLSMVSGDIEYRGSWHDAAEVARGVQVWLKSADDPSEASMASLRAGQHYAFLCVPAGSYRLTTYPQLPLDHPDGIPVEVAETTLDLAIDLIITDPP